MEPDELNVVAVAGSKSLPTPEVWGEFERMLDEKGRVTIPPLIRTKLGREYIMARGNEGYLLAIPQAAWPRIEEWLAESSADIADRYVNFAIHNRSVVSLDRQGRLKIPRHLLEWAALRSGDATSVVGLGFKFEVWNQRRWAQLVSNSNGAGADEAAATLGRARIAALRKNSPPIKGGKR